MHLFARSGAIAIDGGEKLSRITRIGKPGDRNIAEIGIGQIRGAIGEAAAHHFQNHVHALRVVPALQWDTFEHIQSFDHGHPAGAWRRSRDDLPALAVGSVARAESFANLRLIVGEVVQGD